jgi:hypothetical protein
MVSRIQGYGLVLIVKCGADAATEPAEAQMFERFLRRQGSFSQARPVEEETRAGKHRSAQVQCAAASVFSLLRRLGTTPGLRSVECTVTTTMTASLAGEPFNRSAGESLHTQDAAATPVNCLGCSLIVLVLARSCMP